MSTLHSPTPAIIVPHFNDHTWPLIAEAYIRSAHQKSDTETIPPSAWYDTKAESMLYGFGELRLGSLITAHSKLVVCNFTPDALHFKFDPNADPDEIDYAFEEKGLSVDAIQTNFQSRVRKVLSDHNVLHEITSCIDVR